MRRVGAAPSRDVGADRRRASVDERPDVHRRGQAHGVGGLRDRERRIEPPR
jgi:hypothetical protein